MATEQSVPCEPLPLPAEKILWFRGLLRYMRNLHLIHPIEGQLPNVSPLFCALTFDFDDRLQLLMVSNPTARRSRYMAAGTETGVWYDDRIKLIDGVVILVMNGHSPEPALRFAGEARVLPREEWTAGMIVYNGLRDLKGCPNISLDEPRGPNDVGRGMYIVDINYADTQAHCVDENREYVDEAHPTVDIDLLRGFETLPALLPGQSPPVTISELYEHFETSGYQVPAFPSTLY